MAPDPGVRAPRDVIAEALKHSPEDGDWVIWICPSDAVTAGSVSTSGAGCRGGATGNAFSAERRSASMPANAQSVECPHAAALRALVDHIDAALAAAKGMPDPESYDATFTDRMLFGPALDDARKVLQREPDDA
jgi:hypothetical protein